jgi:hypothetical protein
MRGDISRDSPKKASDRYLSEAFKMVGDTILELVTSCMSSRQPKGSKAIYNTKQFTYSNLTH